MPQPQVITPEIQEPELETPPPRGSGRKVIWIIVVLVIVALGVSWMRSRHPSNAPQQAGNQAQRRQGGRGRGAAGFDASRPVPVAVAPVQQQNVPVYLEGLGNIQAY